MGLNIKKHKNGKFTVIESVSDEVVVKNGTEDDVKKYLLVKKIWKFYDDMIQIDMEFPHRYFINNKMHIDESKENFLEWWIANCDKEGFGNIIGEKMEIIIKKFELEEYFNPFGTKEDEIS